MTSIEWFELAEWKIIMDLKNENISFEQFCIMRELFLNQAKEMHKQEVEDAFQEGKWDWAEQCNNGTKSIGAAQYYKETFKNK